jgi:hypothetical protein
MFPPDNERRSPEPRPGSASSSSISDDSAPLRLVPYRLDTPPPRLVSLRRRRFSTMRRVSHLRPKASARPRRPRLDLAPRRCRQGVVPADPTAAEAVNASRQPRAVDDATHTEMTSTIRTQRVTSAPQTPRGLLRSDRCGSTTELLGARVDVRGHGHVSTAAARPACSPRCTGTNQHSTNRRPDNRSPTVHLA